MKNTQQDSSTNEIHPTKESCLLSNIIANDLQESIQESFIWVKLIYTNGIKIIMDTAVPIELIVC